MMHGHSYWVVATSCIAAATGIWLVAVPTSISVPTFAWGNAAACGVGAMLIGRVRSTCPAQLIARTLRETEHPAGSARCRRRG